MQYESINLILVSFQKFLSKLNSKQSEQCTFKTENLNNANTKLNQHITLYNIEQYTRNKGNLKASNIRHNKVLLLNTLHNAHSRMKT